MERLLQLIKDPSSIQLPDGSIWILIGVISIVIFVGLFSVFKLIGNLLSRIVTPQMRNVYRTIIRPSQTWLGLTLLIIIGDAFLIPYVYRDSSPGWLSSVEFILGLAIGINVCFLGFRIFKQFFDVYLLELTLTSSSKANSELLVLTKFAANAGIVLAVIVIFAETHQINLVGLIASLGIGGVAIAFASQKVLEQVLWSILLYLDRPFLVDDYIHLSDGTFGRVEAIGWRSTKIRLSGKGTLVIVPNSMLTQMAIENLSGAQKVISILNIIFHQSIPDEEKALVRQVILESTNDIYGIDHRLSNVTFEDKSEQGSMDNSTTLAQVNFFILGTGDNAMEIRSQLLDIARQNIKKQLKDFGIGFDLEDENINVTSPMNI